MISTTYVNFKPLHPDAVKPSYGTPYAAGADLSANLKLTLGEDYQEGQPFVLMPGERRLIKTGVSVEMPEGMWAEIRGRSGLAYKHGIAILGGVIDSDYRGDIGVIMLNTSGSPYSINHGDRIAQLIFAHYSRATFHTVEELGASDRGEKGFGSTGMQAA